MTKTEFAPRQIVYLTCEESRLYAEVIQVLDDRPLCWVRPLLLVTPDHRLPIDPTSVLMLSDPQNSWHGVRIPDLLWPIEQFNPALDTEFLTLWAALPAHPPAPQAPQISTALNQFMTRLWQVRTTSQGPGPGSTAPPLHRSPS